MPLPAINAFGADGFDVNQGFGSRSLTNYDFDKALVPGLDSDRFASSKSFLIAAGPSRIHEVEEGAEAIAGEAAAGAAITDLAGKLTAIGLVQDFNLSQNRGMSEIPEVGSRAIYYMAGRTSRRVSLSKVLFNGASLMRALYQEAGDFESVSAGQSYEQLPAADKASKLYINLESRFFEKPHGIFLRMDTLSGANSIDATQTGGAATQGKIGGVYLEECYISAHGVSTNANNTIVAENVALTCARLVPIDETAYQRGGA